MTVPATNDVALPGLAEAGALIAAGTLSPVELTRACLERIERLDPVLNAFVCVTAEAAMAEAERAEAEIAAGRRRGPLHGVPYALKDIYDTAGIATTGHSARCAGRVPEADGECVRRLRAAGAVLVGKLATHEFATGGPSYDLPWPPSRNPWALERFPGGSSSGSGTAVAAGMVPLALGSDTGGSIRLPAAYCGVVGLKPTYGRVSKRGVLPLSWTMDNCGPLTWTVEDAAIAMQAIAGHDPGDPCSADMPVPDFRAGLGEDLKGVRVGLVRHFYEEDRRASEATLAAMDAAVAVLRDLGAKVREVRMRSLATYQSCFRLIAIAESYAVHQDHLAERADEYGDVFRYRIMPGALVSAADYVQAQRNQRRLTGEALALLGEVDVLLTATTPGEAPVMADMRAVANFSQPPLTSPFNVTQLPAIAVCNGFSPAGLPLSMQVAARPFAEALALRVAHAYERASEWRSRRPVLPASPCRDTPEPEIAPVLGPRERADMAALAEILGLSPDARELDRLGEVRPYLDGMSRALERDRGLGEPANIFTFEGMQKR